MALGIGSFSVTTVTKPLYLIIIPPPLFKTVVTVPRPRAVTSLDIPYFKFVQNDLPPALISFPGSLNTINISISKNLVNKALYILYKRDTIYYTPVQQKAAYILLQPNACFLVRMPTGAKKSLLIIFSGCLQRNIITLIMISFVVLRTDLRRNTA